MSGKPIQCSERFVRCDGGDPERGHPAVFLDLSKSGKVVCPYCGLAYVSSHFQESHLS